MCSGLFSSSANGAKASRASAYLGLSTSTSTDRSACTIRGFDGSNCMAGAGGAGLALVGVVGMAVGIRWNSPPDRALRKGGAGAEETEVPTRDRVGTNDESVGIGGVTEGRA